MQQSYTSYSQSISWMVNFSTNKTISQNPCFSLWMENSSSLLILTSTSKMRTFLNRKFTAIKRKTRIKGTQSNLSKKQVWKILSSMSMGATLGTLIFLRSLNSPNSILAEILLPYLKKIVLYSLWNHLFWPRLKAILKKFMNKWKI